MHAPLADVQRILLSAREPKKLWVVPAVDNRFSNNLDELDRPLLDAMDWVVTNQAAYDIAAIDLSFGFGNYTSACSTPFRPAIQAANAAGISVVAAS